MEISRKKAQRIGWGSILVAMIVQIFNDVSCYNRGIFESISTIWFPGIPLIPALVFLASRNPLRAVGASIVAIAFYALAYYTDCVAPYEGGGASMIYVAVILYGTPLAAVGGLIAGSITNGVVKDDKDANKAN